MREYDKCENVRKIIKKEEKNSEGWRRVVNIKMKG